MSKQAEKYGTKVKARRAPGDNVLPDQFQTVAAVLASDLVPENLCFSGTNQKPERWRPFGTYWSGKTLSPRALLAVLYFSSCLIFLPV